MCEIVQFGDDIAIFSSSPKSEIALSIIEKVANKTFRYLTSKGLTVSLDKFVVVLFTKKRIAPGLYSIKLNNIPIMSCKSHRFLGVILDQKLSGEEHILNIFQKCFKLTNIIRSLRVTWWGAYPRTLLQIYKATIRSSMKYDCFFFPYNNYSLMKKLNLIQYRAIMLCLGNTTPTNVILAEAGEGLLESRFFFLTSRFLLKTFSQNTHPVLDKLYFLYYYA